MRLSTPPKSCLFAMCICLLSVQMAAAQDETSHHGKHSKLLQLLKALRPDEQARYREARKRALQNADVRAAEERRRKASAEYHELLDREMLRADPSLKPIIEKVAELRKQVDQ